MHCSSLCPRPSLAISAIISRSTNLQTIAIVTSIVQFGPTGSKSNFDTMSANNSLYSPPSSSSSSVANGLTGQGCAPPTSRRNSFDTVIAIANDRAAAATQDDVVPQASSSAASESSPSSTSCATRSRNSESFDVKSQTWTDSFEAVELQDQFWPTASRLAAMKPESSYVAWQSDAAAVALAFQKQAQTGKRSLWKEWAPYFGL
jgi:hypothetical protein